MKASFKIMFASAAVLTAIAIFSCSTHKKNDAHEKNTLNAKIPAPNVLIIVTDELRAQATSYAGDNNIKTPNLDKLASMSVNFTNAVSGMSVCTPFRGSLITGQRPITNGMFMNDIQLDTNAVTMGKIYSKAGYDTGYIGKWHMDGHGRTKFIPPGNRRQGFQFWQANECTHNYNRSVYYDNNDPTPRTWGDYDTFSQTDAAISYMDSKKGAKNPFLLVLAWGTPHSPYTTAPEKYKKMFNPADIKLRPNVPTGKEAAAKEELAGYYAHIAALDEMVGKIMANLKATNKLDNTIVLFTSDHGNLSDSHGYTAKQQPYAESVKVPMLFYVPKGFGINAGERNAMINSEDLLPTLLSLCNLEIPKTVEGINYTPYMQGKDNTVGEETIITCVQPFGQWNRKREGKEYRGLVTPRYTYVKDLNGPWLFFDNEKDPYQMKNLVNNADYKTIQEDLEKRLLKRLKNNKDAFLPGMEYVKKWGYTLDESGTVPFH